MNEPSPQIWAAASERPPMRGRRGRWPGAGDDGPGAGPGPGAGGGRWAGERTHAHRSVLSLELRNSVEGLLVRWLLGCLIFCFVGWVS